MAVKIRLKRMGKIRAPYYRIVVADARTKRDGRVIEEIGKYHPKEEPSIIEVDSSRAQYWLGVGAQPSEPVTAILKVTGDWQLFKGEAAPPPKKVAEPRRDKADLFNEALKDSHGDPAAEAVTARRSTARKATAAAAPAADQPVPTMADAPVEEASGLADAPAETATIQETRAVLPAEEVPVAEVTPAEEVPAAETSPVPADAANNALSDDAPGEVAPDAPGEVAPDAPGEVSVEAPGDERTNA